MSDSTNKGELLMQIEALRAQVEQLKQNRDAFREAAYLAISILQINKIKTPAGYGQQCLAEIKAQAGRDAVISALRLYGEPTMTVSEIDLLADKYANQILQVAKEQQNES